MEKSLSNEEVKYKVVVGSKVISESLSKTGADIVYNQLCEEDRRRASIVPIATNGNEVLLG